MIKFTIFLTMFVGTSAVDFGAIARGFAPAANSKNITVVYRNEFRQTEQTLILERCALEDCSDTPQS